MCQSQQELWLRTCRFSDDSHRNRCFSVRKDDRCQQHVLCLSITVAPTSSPVNSRLSGSISCSTNEHEAVILHIDEMSYLYKQVNYHESFTPCNAMQRRCMPDNSVCPSIRLLYLCTVIKRPDISSFFTTLLSCYFSSHTPDIVAKWKICDHWSIHRYHRNDTRLKMCISLISNTNRKSHYVLERSV